jgi:hypothetical protein
LYSEPLELPRGNYAVDTAVTDEQAGSTSVRRLSVTVNPGTDLSLSSLQFVGRVEPSQGPRNPLDPFDLGNGRIYPTLADSVSAKQPLQLFFIVYPSKTSSGEDRKEDPKVTLQLFQNGNEVAKRPVVLPQPATDGSLPVVVELSPGPGQCYVIVTAEQGKLAAQSARSLLIE